MQRCPNLIGTILSTTFLLATVSIFLPVYAEERPRWPVELSVGQFKIHSDFEIESTQTLVDELTGMTREVEQLLGVSLSEKTVHIVLFRTASEYSRYMRNYFPKLPERRALFIQDRGPGMLFTHWHSDVATDLRHEVTHALLNEATSSLPLWLDEGLAEYFEVEHHLRFSGNPYLQEVRERARQGFVPSLKQLEQVERLAEFGDTHYRDSWSWIHFLMHRSSRTRALLAGYVQGTRGRAQQLDLSRQLAALMPDAAAEYQQHFASLP